MKLLGPLLIVVIEISIKDLPKSHLSVVELLTSRGSCSVVVSKKDVKDDQEGIVNKVLRECKDVI